ncbi:unnamed protein product [Calypogeia fissa]
MAAAATAVHLTSLPYLPPLGSIHRIPAASVSPICPIIRRLHLSPSVSHGLRPLTHFRIQNVRNRSVGGYPRAEFTVPARCYRLLSRAELFEFRSKNGVFQRSGVTARAAAGAVGGDSKFVEYKEFLVVVLKTLEALRQRILQWAPWLALVTGTLALVGVLSSRFGVGRVFAAMVIAASFFYLLVEDEKLQLIGEGFEPVYVKVGHHVHILSGAISKTADDSHRYFAYCLSSIIPILAGKLKGNSAESLLQGESLLISEAGGVSLAPNCGNDVSRSENLSLDCKPSVEMLVTNISESIAQLRSLTSTAGLSAASPDSLSGIKSGIQDLCRELQSVEAALLTPESELGANVSQGIVEALDSQSIPVPLPSNLQYEQTSDQPVSSKCSLVEDASQVQPIHQSVTSLSTHLEGMEGTLQVSPLPSGTWSTTAITGNEAKGGESVHSEVWETIPKREPTVESASGMGESSSEVNDSHLLDFQDFSAINKPLVEQQSPNSKNLTSSKQSVVMGRTQRRRSRSPDPWHTDCTTTPTKQDELAKGDWATSSVDVSSTQQTQVTEPRWERSRSPDPWQSDCTTRPIEQEFLAGSNWAATSSYNYRDDQGHQLLEISLIDNEHSKTNTPRKDAIGNGRGGNLYGRVDFWGKNSGSLTKGGEQRGTLTKSKATARGNSFGSMGDLDGDLSQEQGRRRSLEEDQQQPLRRDSPSTSKSSSRAGGQPWDEEYKPGTPAREAVRDDQRMYRDADSSPASDDYRRVEADIRGPQELSVDRDLGRTKNTPLVSMERKADAGMPPPRYRTDAREDIVYPASVDSRASPPGRTGSTRISSSGPSTSQEGDARRRTQSMDDARVANEGDYSGSKRAWDVRPNQGVVSRGQESSGPGNGKGTPDSLAYTPTQPEVVETNFALEQSKQARTVKFENYLDEAEALMEQGMQGLEGRIEVGVAERMLYEAADLLGKACEIYPANLIAVGQLGNTLLVHGQLKLKLSQQLRSMLPSRKANSAAAPPAGREQDSMEVTLQEVCEECEELLVDAGRKFRTALSVDKSDVRALYNWGLALCYRAQLIAEEGGERAMQDADKVYLAAIDKFEAMLGISQDYVSGALLNWGLAMRDRARLREMGDKDRVQLLLQAKELFQDAVRLDPNNGQARGALAVCSAEMKELESFEALQREDTIQKPTRNWWQRRG